MRMLTLAFVTYKRMIKEIGTLSFMFIMPMLVILAVFFLSGKEGRISDVNVAFNIKDKGGYGQEILKDLNISKNIFVDDENGALELLEKNDVAAVYSIPENFTAMIKEGRKPLVESFKLEEGNALASVEVYFNDKVNKKLKEQILLNNNVIKESSELNNTAVKSRIVNYEKDMSKELFLVVILILYFIILSANTIGTELLNLKKQKVLSRAITTANRGYEIVGGIYLAMFLLQISINLVILFLSKLLLGYSITGLHVVIVNIILASMVSISLGLFITRVVENPAVASVVLTLITVATTFLGMLAISGDEIRQIPWVLQNLAKFTPQYWLLDTIDQMQLFPNIFALLLMALAMFTAGNFRLRNFINKN